MLVETSAIVAMMLEETDAEALLEQVNSSERPVTTVINAFEATLSIGRKLKDHVLSAELVPQFLESAGIEMIGVDASLYPVVADAYLRYGKGTGHPARLNFGDCFSYAYAKQAGVPLLYKGNDFAKTDLAGL
jgi:ribonuclease VapC